MIKKSSIGFTLVEIMITLFIISLLIGIAIYGYAKSNTTARRTICIANLKEIDSAIDQWVLENHISIGTSISDSEEEIYNDYVKGSRPKCPTGGQYVLGTVGIKPQVTCSREGEGHTLSL
ncbi:MAG: prepilin-type N-terminal cleavage/methylation domain-containing protein [Candidatus Omnitrophica bacterium]|nr:prepilin-type N-terminal cleavage/methylation domain-containing protein [Candidatus Omnitrophota bacterium]